MSQKPSRLPLWAVIPPAVYLFILPFAHTISVRWVALGLGIIAAIRYQRVAGVPRIPCILPIALWIIVAAMSLVQSEDFGYSLGEFRIDILYAMAGFIVLYTLTESERGFLILVWSILSGACVISVIAITNYLRYNDWLAGYQNFLGEFSSCMLMAIAVIPLAASEKSAGRWRMTSIVIALAIVFAAGLCTRSRMFWVAAFSMCLVAGTMYSWGKPRKIRVAVAAGLLLTIFLSAAGFIFASIHHNQDKEDPRLAIWHQAFQDISEKPFIGAGFGREIYKQRYEALMPGQGWYHAHNIFLSYGEQMGVQGIAVLVLLFLSLLREFAVLWKLNDPITRNIGVAGTALVVGVIVKSTTDMHFAREVTLYFWAIMGMLLGFGRRRANALRNDRG